MMKREYVTAWEKLRTFYVNPGGAWEVSLPRGLGTICVGPGGAQGNWCTLTIYADLRGLFSVFPLICW